MSQQRDITILSRTGAQRVQLGQYFAFSPVNMGWQITPLIRSEAQEIGLPDGVGTVDATVLGNSRLGVIYTDRNLVEKRGELHIFAFVPSQGNKTVKLLIAKDGDEASEKVVQLDTWGLAHFVEADLEVGNYVVTCPEVQAEAKFSVAEYVLAQLNATLISSQIEPIENVLNVSISLTDASGRSPHSQLVHGQLVAGDVKVDEVVKESASSGLVHFQFKLSEVEGSLAVTVFLASQPKKTASVAIQGGKLDERKVEIIQPLGQQMQTSTLGLQNSQKVRGVFLQAGDTANTPFAVENMVSGVVVLRTQASISQAVVTVVSSETGQVETYPIGRIMQNREVRFTYDGPWCQVFIGALVLGRGGEQPWEGWTNFIKPSELQLQLSVPKTIEPGEQLVVDINTNKLGSVSVVLVIRDARLTSETPEAKIGGRLKKLAIVDSPVGYVATDLLAAWQSQQIFRGGTRGWGNQDDGVVFEMSAVRRGSPLEAMTYGTLGGGMTKGVDLSLYGRETETEPEIATPRNEKPANTVFAGLLYLEKGSGRQTVRLPETMTTYAVQVFAYSGGDWMELEKQVRVNKPVYAALSVPQYLGEHDASIGSAMIVCESGEATVDVSINGTHVPFKVGDVIYPAGAHIQTPAEIEFIVKPGTVQVTVFDEVNGEADSAETVVQVLGKFKYRKVLSRVLMPGQTFSLDGWNAQRMWVKPGLQDAQKSVTIALADYGHDCCQQTLAKMYPQLIMALQGDEKALALFIKGVGRLREMFVHGRGFKMYPESSTAQTDGYYQKQAAELAWGLRLFSKHADLDQYPTLVAELRNVVYYGEQAMKAYNLPLYPREIVTFRQAYEIAKQGLIQQALEFATVEYVRISQKTSVPAQVTENMAYASAVFALAGQLEQAIEIANLVFRRFTKDGRPYSTGDSLATMLMLMELQVMSDQSMVWIKANLKGQLYDLKYQVGQVCHWQDGGLIAYSATAMEHPVVIAYEVEEEEDWAQLDPTTPINVGLWHEDGRPATGMMSAGTALILKVSLPDGYSFGDLVHVCLPPALSRLFGGGQVKLFTVDLRGKSEVKIELIATESTHAHFEGEPSPQKFAVILRNMFDQRRFGSSGQMHISIW